MPKKNSNVKRGAKCPSCGGQVSAKARFCGQCGASIRQDEIPIELPSGPSKAVSKPEVASGPDILIELPVQPVSLPPVEAKEVTAPTVEVPLRSREEKNEEAKCGSCGATLSKNARFCGGCGVVVERSVPRAVPITVGDRTVSPPSPVSPLRAKASSKSERPTSGAPVLVRHNQVSSEQARPSRRRGVGWGKVVAAIVVLAIVFLLGRGLWGGEPEVGTQQGTSSGKTTGSLSGVSSVSDVGTARAEVTPEKGAALVAGSATVEFHPLSVEQTTNVKAEMKADHSLSVTLDPPQELAVPVSVTLPLPEGSALGDDPSTWPVALLEGDGQEPLILVPDGISGGRFSVLVPHFSNVQPMLYSQALQKTGNAGQQVAKQLDPYAPASISVDVSLPPPVDEGNDAAEIDNVTLSVRVKARTTENGGLPVIKDKKLDSKWTNFDGLTLKVYTSKKEVKLDWASDEFGLTNGANDNISFKVNGVGGPYSTIWVVVVDKAGTRLFAKAVSVPTGKYWSTFNCASNPAWKEFSIRYLRDTKSTNAPDYSYKANTSTVAVKGVPARVCDACELLSDAYDKFSGKDWFNDPANTPSLPMEVVMQPWHDSQAGNQSNWLRISTRTQTYENFRTDVAHELAHRFQHQYSIGYSDQWYHDASAEYLAQRLYTSDKDVASYVGENTGWMSDGGVTWAAWGGGYGAASFIAYMSDKYGVNAAQAWVKGASGWENLNSWESYFDKELKAKTKNQVSLSQAWSDFSRSYLLDHSLWGSWTNARGQTVETAALLRVAGNGSVKDRDFSGGSIVLQDPGAKGRKSTNGLYGFANVKGAYYLSAAGQGFSWTGQDVSSGQSTRRQSATVVLRVNSRAGSGWFGVVNGWQVSGCSSPQSCQELSPFSQSGKIAGGEYTYSLRFGDITGTFLKEPNDKNDYIARVTYWYSDWSGSPLASNTVKVEAWAIPELLGVEKPVAQTGGGTSSSTAQSNKLRWKLSPLETEKDAHGAALFGGYQIVGIDNKSGAITVLSKEPLKKGASGLTTVKVKNNNGVEEEVYEFDLGTLSNKDQGDTQKIGVRVVDLLGNSGPESWVENAFLRPGVWNLGEGFLNEVVLKYENGQLVGRFASPDGTQHRVVFKPFDCSESGAAICFEAVWDNPNALQCSKWDYTMTGASKDGKSYEALYVWADSCSGIDDYGRHFQNDPTHYLRLEVKGKWLRDWDGGPVDGSYDESSSTTEPALPVGTNPLGNQ